MKTISHPQINNGRPIPLIEMGKITDPEVLVFLKSIGTPLTFEDGEKEE